MPEIVAVRVCRLELRRIQAKLRLLDLFPMAAETILLQERLQLGLVAGGVVDILRQRVRERAAKKSKREQKRTTGSHGAYFSPVKEVSTVLNLRVLTPSR